MPNLKWFLCGWLVMIAAIANSLLPIPPFSASQPANAQSQLSWKGMVNTIFAGKEPRAPYPGRRGSPRPVALCPITPTTIFWHPNPLFVWQGSYPVIGVRAEGDNRDNSEFWWDSASTQPQSVMRLPYTGKVLVPGKRYEWVFFADRNRRSPLYPVLFEVMGEQEQAAIAKDLQTLETRLKAQKASEEEIVLQRTNYFAEKGLQGDALQEIYSVKQPSAAIKRTMQEIEKKQCQE